MLDPLEMTALTAKAGTLDLDPLEMTALTDPLAVLDPLVKMTALTAKGWGVLKRWQGSPGSLKNDSFEPKLPGGFWRVRRAVLDPLEMTALQSGIP